VNFPAPASREIHQTTLRLIAVNDNRDCAGSCYYRSGSTAPVAGLDRAVSAIHRGHFINRKTAETARELGHFADGGR